MGNLGSYAIIIILTILSGVADAQGFLFAAQYSQTVVSFRRNYYVQYWGLLSVSDFIG
jgi:hypothetical protein